MKLQPPVGTDVAAELRRVVDDLNRFNVTIPEMPVFADDPAAAAGRVRIGEGYVDLNGFVRRRRA